MTKGVHNYSEIEGPLQLFELSLGAGGEIHLDSMIGDLAFILAKELGLPAVKLIRCGGDDAMAAQDACRVRSTETTCDHVTSRSPEDKRRDDYGSQSKRKKFSDTDGFHACRDQISARSRS